ncbi:MAG: hypothetical protein JWO08_2241 [Verrucomicrobiaceae bacterium]|nr:hypothetical protein [Verrucomicrobiaceae bacterium]
MKQQSTKAPGGGPVAIRGFLVQTLVALLEIATADPPFLEITLEPQIGAEQFDFVWTDGTFTQATQVKSTVNSFTKSDLNTWAAKMEAAHVGERCVLVLVGLVPPSLDRLDHIGAVKIEKKNLNIEDLLEQAAHRLAKFLEMEAIQPGTANEREMIVHALVSKLEHYATHSAPLRREAFVGLLRGWIKFAPRKGKNIDISRIDKYAPSNLIGRQDETHFLNETWNKAVLGECQRPRIISIVAFGGEGKTSLVAKWAAELAHREWPGCDTAYAWSFYSQGTQDQVAASSDLFFAEALSFFGDPAMASSADSGFTKGKRLARLIGEQRALLLLDGVEPLQYAPTSSMQGELKDQGLTALLKGLAATSLGLCVVTTRNSLSDLRNYLQTTVHETRLTRLSAPAGVQLLKSLGTVGAEQEIESLVEDVKGHALTLNLFGSYLRNAHAGDIRKRGLVKLGEADTEEQNGHGFRVMDAYVRWFLAEGEKGYQALAILRCLGLFDRPATAECLVALEAPPGIAGLTRPLVRLSEAKRNIVFQRLQAANLLSVLRNGAGVIMSVDSHPLLREYFAQERSAKHAEAWRAAHRRLYEFLCLTTKEGHNPTIEELQPLYQAVVHGCNAGLQQEACVKVYDARIKQGSRSYTSKQLGSFGSDLGAVTCFFDQPWKVVSSAVLEARHAWLFNEAAIKLGALGRLSEAVEPVRTGVKMAVANKKWVNAARGGVNLSEIEVTLGKLEDSLQDAEASVIYASRSSDSFSLAVAQATRAGIFHQMGRWAEAQERFSNAEKSWAITSPTYPLLYSTSGFKYLDFLLAFPEQCSWRKMLGNTKVPATELGSKNAEIGKPLQEEEVQPEFSTKGIEAVNLTLLDVFQRASQLLEWSEDQKSTILDTTLLHLIHARTTLCRAILALPPILQKQELGDLVEGLRRSGYNDHIPRGLLIRAWHRFFIGTHTGPKVRRKISTKPGKSPSAVPCGSLWWMC